MRTLARTLSLVALTLTAVACRSSGGSERIPEELLDTTVYTKVGMHFDTQRGRYVMHSTNYIGVPIYMPPGTQMTLNKKSRKGFTLVDGDGTECVITWEPRHSMMSMDKWFDMNFSTTPFQLPEGLSEQEQRCIAEGVAEVGMSREAVFLALGYPPKSNNPSLRAKSLKWETRRFFGRRLHFDDQGIVTKISRR